MFLLKCIEDLVCCFCLWLSKKTKSSRRVYFRGLTVQQDRVGKVEENALQNLVQNDIICENKGIFFVTLNIVLCFLRET